MTTVQLALALLGLLLTPGPTNTLLALAGAERGWRAALRLIPFEVAAYLLVVVPLATLGAAVTEALPVLRPVLAVVAGAWVMSLAIRMWRLPTAGAPAEVTARRVFLTTLLNPKALLIGLALLPGPDLAGRVVLFAGLIVAVAAVWAALGACMSARADCPARSSAPLIRRLAATWLGALSLGLIFSAAQAAIF